MNLAKAFSRRFLFGIIFILGICMLIANFVFYFGLDYLFSVLSSFQRLDEHTEIFNYFDKLEVLFKQWGIYFAPASLLFFIFLGTVFWFILRGVVKKIRESSPFETGTDKTKNVKRDFEKEKKLQKQNNRRFFIHLLSVFQKQGRLVDFFLEDIDEYSDDQIGAAVRTIHASCKKELNKYLSPKPLMNQDEGEDIEILDGFDPAEIKLTGNVTGEPPFSGILRHKGWRVSKLDLPALSDNEDSVIIAPAEVEIL